MTDTTTRTRADIEQEIREARAKQERMPEHWVERRAVVGDAIDVLVDEWLEAGA